MKTNIVFKNMAFFYAAGSIAPLFAQEAGPKRPNFVWFMTEDVSKHYLSLYNDGKFGAVTPNVEKLAKEGIIFNNAYSNAPVSSAARSTLITGCYATRLGASFHRKLELVPMPEGLDMFPTYLKKAGYYTTNSAKTDYNCMMDQSAWDEVNAQMDDWRNRPDKNKPFFLMRTNGVTHEAKLQFNKANMQKVPTSHKPEEVFIHPYHPDTPLFRYTYATFYDRIQESDKELGKLMKMLESDGELENTFIFYFGDNGGSLPGTKGYTTEPGIQVPLVVYVPKKWRDLLPVKAGTSVNGFVSFVDLGPTLLHLAGIQVPKQMDGTPILGTDIPLKQLNSRDEVYGYGDRFDELYAFNRTLRKGDFKYSRNFQPYHPKSLYTFYRYRQAAFREWKSMYKAGKLNEVQSRFFEPQGAEELYDLSTDPYETKNLANNPQYKQKLIELRSILKRKIVNEHDLGFFPECVWLEKGQKNPTQFGLNNAQAIQRYSNIADLEFAPFKKSESSLRKALSSADPVDRYWGATVCASLGTEATPLLDQLNTLLKDPQSYVRSRAIVALRRIQKMDVLNPMKEALKLAKSGAESLLILNDIAYLKDSGLETQFNLSTEDVPQKCSEVEWRLKYLKNK